MIFSDRLRLAAECREYRRLVILLNEIHVRLYRVRHVTDERLTDMEARVARVIGKLSREGDADDT